MRVRPRSGENRLAASSSERPAASPLASALCGRRPLVAFLLAASALACGNGDEASRPGEAPATPLVFTAHGLPGPWWKVGGAPREFQRDSRACRGRSTRARERATRDALETAYRAFLDCMEERMWQRGTPPK